MTLGLCLVVYGNFPELFDDDSTDERTPARVFLGFFLISFINFLIGKKYGFLGFASTLVICVLISFVYTAFKPKRSKDDTFSSDIDDELRRLRQNREKTKS